MLLLIILVALFIIGIVLFKVGDAMYAEGMCIGGISICILTGGIIVIMVIVLLITHISVPIIKASCIEEYNSLTYQLENNVYDNDNDVGKYELYSKITEWNKYLAEGKAMQHNIWVGVFIPNIYDEFEFIEFPNVEGKD